MDIVKWGTNGAGLPQQTSKRHSKPTKHLAGHSAASRSVAAERRVGAATGLGSENNVKLAEQGKKPFFNWIDCDDVIATARGGGGGLALWTRTDQP